jgi:hypothetical protein
MSQKARSYLTYQLSVALMAAALFLPACGAESLRPPSGDRDAGGLVDAPVLPDIPNPPEDVADEMVEPTPLENGASCIAAGQCESGFCADGVCCETVCEGLCVSCAVSGSAGTCTAHAAGTDPDNDCADDGASSCRTDGECDGAGACRRYPEGTTCAAVSCMNAMLTGSGRCDAQGACQRPAAMSCGKFQCNASNACRTTCTTNAECVSPHLCTDGVCGGGLTGRYYNGADFDTLVLTRIDPKIDFNWEADNPAPGVNADLFSVRWTGTITPRFSERYTFFIGSSDGERMQIGTTWVITNFMDHVATPEDQGAIDLVAGRAYPILIEYYERYTNASIRLSWSSMSEPKAVVPASAVSPQAPP